MFEVGIRASAVAALLLLAPPSAGAAEEAPAERFRAAPAGETPLALVPIYRVPGVRDGATAATVLHCTNLGAANAQIGWVVRDFDGTTVCDTTAALVELPPNETATLETRGTMLYEADRICNPAAQTNTGYAVVIANNTGSTRVICTAQVVDPAAATPVFATTLDLFRP